MSTIASPRLSITSLGTPSSSRRASIDTSQANSPSRPPKPLSHQPRRGNRAALRDYYGLRANDSAPAVVQTEPAAVEESEMDREGFQAEEYLGRVMEKQRLEEMLTVEGGLVNDGERKALVYDNYSKLITATDTIRKMRSNMDPLTPTTSTLPPALSHIAETASTLATILHERTPPSPFSPSLPRRSLVTTPATANDSNGGKEEKEEEEEEGEGASARKRRDQVRTVKWVLDAPNRMREMIKDGRREEAEREWEVVRGILANWEGVRGVEEVRREGEEALRGR
ncbi:hypothetical protein GP486_007383 [Trichoglossum hirsutum]|uniref:Vacuolar protein sorting-associated protein 51 homolog n=1 Tax=Trichoglossum hirsutum TaxID=265104 RepID=A0A9P8I6G3_9PEZI|nr:hypothetical protein GP486_007383 [Trichoglossum hirsutum]